ncbi:hypothetical protein X777_15339, partial [Ooceraea biroi]
NVPTVHYLYGYFGCIIECRWFTTDFYVVREQSLEDSTRFLANTYDLCIFALLWISQQLITNVTGHTSVHGATQTTIASHRNDKLLRLFRWCFDFSLLIEHLCADAKRTSLLQVTFRTIVFRC